MPDVVIAPNVMFFGAEKDLIHAALMNAPESRDRDSILALISKTGTNDGILQLTAEQKDYIVANLAELMKHPALHGTTYDTNVALQMARDIEDRIGPPPAWANDPQLVEATMQAIRRRIAEYSFDECTISKGVLGMLGYVSRDRDRTGPPSREDINVHAIWTEEQRMHILAQNCVVEGRDAVMAYVPAPDLRDFTI